MISHQQIRAWLYSHRHAWDGWPSTTAIERQEFAARAERLLRHDCTPLRDLISQIDDEIATIRLDARRRYVKHAADSE